MRTVYLGTSAFAAAVLERLAASAHRPVLVVTRPDRPRGRGRRLSPPPVAVTARALGIDVAQPERLHDPESLALIDAAEPELLCVCAYGVLIREPLLSREMLNVHPSLLPRWRGAAPVERAIMAGDHETGVSIMRLTAGLDSGPVCLSAAEPIHPTDDYGTLAARLQRLGGDLLVRALDERPPYVEQDDAQATYAHKIEARDRALDPTRPPAEVERVVRALRPHIGARVALPDGTFLGVVAARVDGPTQAPAGGLVRTEGERLLLDCRGGALELTEVRPPGRGPMPAAAWLRGRPDPALTTFRLDPTLPDRDLAELIELAREDWASHDEWGPYLSALALRGGYEVLEAMRGLADDPDSAVRGVAAHVLGQLGTAARAFPEAQASALEAMAARERDVGVLTTIACAFGHLGEPYGLDALLALREHAAPEVREGVAFGLGGRRDERALAALIELSADAETQVRDWATFALGTLAPQDTPALRDALAARLDDPHVETRLEAVHGLALRGDERAAEPALRLLGDADGDDRPIWPRHLLRETAARLAELTGDPRFARWTRAP